MQSVPGFLILVLVAFLAITNAAVVKSGSSEDAAKRQLFVSQEKAPLCSSETLFEAMEELPKLIAKIEVRIPLSRFISTGLYIYGQRRIYILPDKSFLFLRHTSYIHLRVLEIQVASTKLFPRNLSRA